MPASRRVGGLALGQALQPSPNRRRRLPGRQPEDAGNVTGANVNAGGLSLSGNVLSVLNSTSNINTTGNITANNITGTTSISINGQALATVDDATALAIALG